MDIFWFHLFARFKIFSGDINNVDQLASWVDAAVGAVADQMRKVCAFYFRGQL